MPAQPHEFVLVLSDRGVVAESDKTIETAVKALGESGFINYFGLQVEYIEFLLLWWLCTRKLQSWLWG